MRQELLSKVERIVVKFGTGILTDSSNRLDREQLRSLVSQISGLHAQGYEMTVVSSGAVGAGMGLLKFEKRPDRLEDLQALAAVGQPHLVSAYDKLFSERDIVIAQTLLTHDDLHDRERHINARNTLVSLLKKRVIPIINENDAVSYTELKFGDNDRLSALVTCLIPCDLLVILTGAEGLIENIGGEQERLIPTVREFTPELFAHAKGPGSATSTGGMITKLEATRTCARSGIPSVIAPGRRPDVLEALLRGEEVGTIFLPNPDSLCDRKRWIAFYHHPKASVYVNEDTKRILQNHGVGLRSEDVVRVEGKFQSGDVIEIHDQDRSEFARGLAAFDSDHAQVSSDGNGELILPENLALL